LRYPEGMESTPLAKLLRDLRARQGSSLRAAARDLGVDPAHLSRLERGGKPASDNMLERAARYYDISLEELERAQGELPDDVVGILLQHPEVIDQLREKYGSE
jgi:transcriptional regulator with XRE-family HTH domain